MKKLALLLAAFLCVAVVQADTFVGYDGPCLVYFEPGHGYYEVCDNEPVFLGLEWHGIHFRHGFRHGEKHGHFHGHRH